MSAQTSYKFNTQLGIAGGIVDLAPYAVDTFINAEETGSMKFGVAVVSGTNAGVEIKLPTATTDKFEGVTVNNLTTEYDLEGNINIRKATSVGVMRYGRIYVRVADSVTPAYGDAAYVVATGTQAGYFTNSSSSTLAVKGRFLGTVDSAARIAQVELFNEAQA